MTPPYLGTNVVLPSTPGACPWCSTETSVTVHNGPCPRLRSIEYFPDRTVKRVEFHHPHPQFHGSPPHA